MDKKVKVTYDALKTASEAIITEYVFKHSLEVPESLKAEIEAICESIINTVVKKNQDYSDAWQRYGMFTGLIRENDKLLRVETLADGRQALVAEEKIGDTLTDIVGYGLLLRLWMDGQSDVKEDKLVYRVDGHVYTKEEWVGLGFDKNYGKYYRGKQLPLAVTDEEGVIHKIVDADKVEHDNKIYEDELPTIVISGHKLTVLPIDGYVTTQLKYLDWRTDDCGRHFIFESDLNIQWEQDSNQESEHDFLGHEA
jgi:hypothetical protein